MTQHGFVTNNTAESRYEIRLEGDLAGCLDYELADGVMDLTHTTVLDEFKARGGVGSELVSTALDDIAANKLKVKATCPFVKGYIAKHPEYQGLLAAGQSSAEVND